MGPERVLLDSNVLYSAARDETSSFRVLWRMTELHLLVSPYILDEVSRHLQRAEVRANLWRLVYEMHLVSDGDGIEVPSFVKLPSKDAPILKAAIAASADVLLTGDKNHFGHLFGRSVEGVSIESTFGFKSRYPSYFQGQERRGS